MHLPTFVNHSWVQHRTGASKIYKILSSATLTAVIVTYVFMPNYAKVGINPIDFTEICVVPSYDGT